MAPIKAKQPVSWLFLPYWIIANSVGLGLDFGLARIVALAIGAEVFMDTGAPPYGLVDGTFAWIIVGAVLGAAHWFVLHQYVRRAHWWALALILLLASLAAWGGHEDGWVTMPWIPGGVMYGAAFGAISGIPLIWLLRRWSRVENYYV